MENSFFKKFLETGLFDIGEQDERLDHLEKSIVDLKKVLKGDHAKIPTYTLVSLDSNISDQEPSLLEVQDIVTEYWKTLRVKHVDMPRQILRGVILIALYELGKEDAKIARLIYLTGSNFYPYAELGKEKTIIETLLNELTDIAEEDAIQEWSFQEETPNVKVPPLKLKGVNFGSVSLNEDSLEKGFLEAMKNSSTGHNSQHGGTSTWGAHFSAKSSEIIAATFNKAIEELSSSLTPESIELPINKFFSAFKKSLDESLKSSFNSMRSVERRSKLLWWKESLYSKTFRKSYRQLDQITLPIVMAWDLYQELPAISPVSVDFLLKDTFFIVLEKEKEIDFESFFKDLGESSEKSILSDCFEEMNDHERRISLTDFMQLFVQEKVKLEDFQTKTGIKLKDKISYSDLSIALLHDLMVQYLITK